MEKKIHTAGSSKALMACVIKKLPKGASRQLFKFCHETFHAQNLTDCFGRSALHVAASCGQSSILEWLIEDVGLDVIIKDRESGWTALHRALFYGYLTEARLLISNGASINIRDGEGLTAIDIAMKDRRLVDELDRPQYSLEVFTWGENTNFTLGHRNSTNRKNPEIVEYFRKEKVTVKKVVMNKYHTVFLTLCGKVYSCGHGQGGRLGHIKTHTCVEPRLVGEKKLDKVVDIAACVDHTLILMQDGSVYGCGLNNYQQLGLGPGVEGSNIPTEVPGLASLKIKGVSTQLFHTAVYSEKEVYTFGLNGGQLGHRKEVGEMYIATPKEVGSVLHLNPEAKIQHVVCAIGATVVYLSNGDLFSLQNYKCSRILAKWLNIELLQAQGGELDQSVQPDSIRGQRTGGLTLAFKNKFGQLFLWKRHFGSPRKVVFDIPRSFDVQSFCLGLFSVAFVTTEGDAFSASLPEQLKMKSKDTSSQLATATSPKLTKDAIKSSQQQGGVSKWKTPVVELSLHRIPLVHRGVEIAMDKKGRNFAVLQSHSAAALDMFPDIDSSSMSNDLEVFLSEAHEEDSIHDVLLKVGNLTIPSHRYVLASKSGYFKDLFGGKTECLVDISVTNADVFMQFLKYIYTGTCDLLQPGKAVTIAMNENSSESCIDNSPPAQEERKTAANNNKQSSKNKKSISAYQVFLEKTALKSEVEKQSMKMNPLVLLENMAKQFDVINLKEDLQTVSWDDKTSTVKVRKGKRLPYRSLSFDMNALQLLSDVSISCSNGVVIKCHRCILVARLEYFKSMLACDWLESSSTNASLTMAIDGDLLELLLEYVYMDSCPRLDDVGLEQLCSMLVLADQLLVPRLQQLCVQALLPHISLKTVGELLELAHVCNARQLVVICQRFICLNLGALLETRALDMLSVETLNEVGNYYREQFGGFEMKRQLAGVETFLADMEAFKELYTASTALTYPEIKKESGTKGRKKRLQGSFTEETRARKMSASSNDGDIKNTKADIKELESVPPTSLSRTHSKPEISEEMRKSVSEVDEAELINPDAGVEQSREPEPATKNPVTQITKSLKDIMLEESVKASSAKSTPVSSGKKLKKMSQKERKRLSHDQLSHDQLSLEAATETTEFSSSGSTTATSPTPPAKNPWGTCSFFAAPLKDVIAKQQDEGTPQPTKSTQKPPARNATTNTKHVQGVKSWSNVAVQNTSPRQQAAGSTSLEDLHTVPSFSQIMADEEDMNNSLLQATTRSLSLTQVEDEAIQQLYEKYAEHIIHPNMKITVERVQQPMATPTWAGKTASWK